jgi:hypothetical protein
VEPALDGDPARGLVVDRVHELDAVQADVEEPRRHGGERPAGDASPATLRQDPVADLRDALVEVQHRKADAPDEVACAVDDGPLGAGLALPSRVRPPADPLQRLVVGQRTPVPALDGRVGVGTDESVGVVVAERAQRQALPRVDGGLGGGVERSGRDGDGKGGHGVMLARGTDRAVPPSADLVGGPEAVGLRSARR